MISPRAAVAPAPAISQMALEIHQVENRNCLISHADTIRFQVGLGPNKDDWWLWLAATGFSTRLHCYLSLDDVSISVDMEPLRSFLRRTTGVESFQPSLFMLSSHCDTTLNLTMTQKWETRAAIYRLSNQGASIRCIYLFSSDWETVERRSSASDALSTTSGTSSDVDDVRSRLRRTRFSLEASFNLR